MQDIQKSALAESPPKKGIETASGPSEATDPPAETIQDAVTEKRDMLPPPVRSMPPPKLMTPRKAQIEQSQASEQAALGTLSYSVEYYTPRASIEKPS